ARTGPPVAPRIEIRLPLSPLASAKMAGRLLNVTRVAAKRAVIEALRRLKLWSGEPSNLRPFIPLSREETNRNGEYALRLRAESEPAQGTVVETYLASRGLSLPMPDSLRFHPNMKYPGGGAWPAMVAIVTNGTTGKPQSIHRTFLKPDGSGKAPVPTQKMMLG